MPLKRHHHWRERLGRMIESAREVPFDWGTFNCVFHVANCVREMTGVDLAATYRGNTASEAAADAVILSAGSSLEDAIAKTLTAAGCAEVPPQFAQRGDVVFVDNSTPQGMVGIVSLDGRFASCVSEKGCMQVRSNRWRRAWHVGQ